MCERVAIIYAGEVVESGSVHDIFKRTLHPYTEGLLGAIPQVHLNVRRLSPIEGLMPDPTIQRSGLSLCGAVQIRYGKMSQRPSGVHDSGRWA